MQRKFETWMADRGDDLVSRAGQVGLIVRPGPRRWDVVLADPDKRNPQTPAMWRVMAEVGHHVAELAADIVVLTAQGPSFSGGVHRDLYTGNAKESMLGADQVPDDELLGMLTEHQEAFAWWYEGNAVTIAGVQGHALGAGFQLALACDLMVVTPQTRLGMREVSYGLVPYLGGIRTLVHMVGYGAALELVTTGRSMDGAEAQRRGIAVSCVPEENLTTAVNDLANQVLAANAGAPGAAKRVLHAAQACCGEEVRRVERVEQAARLRQLSVARRGFAEQIGL